VPAIEENEYTNWAFVRFVFPKKTQKKNNTLKKMQEKTLLKHKEGFMIKVFGITNLRKKSGRANLLEKLSEICKSELF